MRTARRGWVSADTMALLYMWATSTTFMLILLGFIALFN